MIKKINNYLASLPGALSVLVLIGASIGMSTMLMMEHGFSIMQAAFLLAGLIAARALIRAVVMAVRAGVHNS